ncbi:MAG: thioredoxin-disulfide reductase [Bacillota bacterium]
MAEQDHNYDMLVLGAGPAGLAAAIYACRANLRVLVCEEKLSGGEITATEQLDNYPGFPEGINGMEFGQRLEQQALRFGANIVSGSIEKVVLDREWKKVITTAGEYRGRTVVIATGTRPRSLGVPGEEKLRGRGISFCATCDAPFFRGKKVAVIGGGDAAVEEALYLTRFAGNVLLVHRRDMLRAISYLQDKLLRHPNVEILWDTVVKEFTGEQKLEGILVQNIQDDSVTEVRVDGAFLYVGRIANTAFLNSVEMDASGYIITNEEMETSVPGVYAAGDVRRKFLRQVVTATADGAIAAMMAVRYLQ